jgi:hypothetical protein
MVLKRFYNYIKWLYMQYLLNTALYMLEPAEIKLFNFLIIFLLLTSIYSTYVFLPSQVILINIFMLYPKVFMNKFKGTENFAMGYHVFNQ